MAVNVELLLWGVWVLCAFVKTNPFIVLSPVSNSVKYLLIQPHSQQPTLLCQWMRVVSVWGSEWVCASKQPIWDNGSVVVDGWFLTYVNGIVDVYSSIFIIRKGFVWVGYEMNQANVLACSKELNNLNEELHISSNPEPNQTIKHTQPHTKHHATRRCN